MTPMPSLTKMPALRPARHLSLAISLLMMLLFAAQLPSVAQGNLLLMPRRVIFQGAKRYEELNLANSGSDTARYVISLMHIRMKEDGGFEEIQQPDSGAAFADPYLRFFPHSVVLGPTESQVIKIQLVKASQMAPGEYRSAIYFRAIPSQSPQGDTLPAEGQAKTFSIHLRPIFGISIPVIIRVGESTAAVTVSDLGIAMGEDSVPELSMIFHRSGNMSIYGDIEMWYTPLKGKTVHAGSAKGIAVYTPNHIRRFHTSLEHIPGFDPHAGRLHLVYSSPQEDHAVKLAEAELILH